MVRTKNGSRTAKLHHNIHWQAYHGWHGTMYRRESPAAIQRRVATLNDRFGFANRVARNGGWDYFNGYAEVN